MTVTGATTASVVASGVYSPPFKPVTNYPPAVQVTGTVSGGTNNPTISVNPGTSDSQYAWDYLNAHMMSTPSYRYAYLLWMVLAAITLIYIISHHLRLSGGSLGAIFSRWSMKRHTIGSKKPGRRNRALPSNGALLTSTIIILITLILCVVGSDYITPSSSILDFSTSFRKRDGTSPNYTIGKSFWTSASRFGFMAFALMPLVVFFALKSPPINILSFKALGNLYADKLAVLHRATAWLIWGITTVHVVLWTVQLFEDNRNGTRTWVIMWSNYRFIFGCVAYAALTGVMAFSFRTIRKNRYEFFYISHVVLVFLTIAGCAVHHPVLWYWMAAAMALWGAERVTRLIRFARVNQISHKTTKVPFIAGRPYHDIPNDIPSENAYGMHELKGSTDMGYGPGPYMDKTLPRLPGSSTGFGTREATPDPEFGAKTSGGGYYDEGSLQPLGSYDSRHDQLYRGGAETPTTPTLVNQSGYFDDHDKSQRQRQSGTSIPPRPSSTATPPLPAGYAQAQLLPSRTIRLTIKVPRPFDWAPGQSVLLYLPDLSKYQSHPFTILNNREPEIVLLVKARKGLTRQLFDLVRQRSLASVGIDGARDKRMSLASMRGGEGALQVPPVYIRARVDGPFGSSGRVRWGDYSTVLIICGGSGISFGASICDHVCQLMAQYTTPTHRFKTQRVRLCWVAREYAEIAWVAGQLYRCQQMVPPDRLQISIFVTKSSGIPTGFAPPQPGFARYGGRRDSVESNMSEMSGDYTINVGGDGGFGDDHTIDSSHGSTHYADVIDLTNYEDEEDVHDLAEQQLSDRLQQQGKVRRAKSRRAGKGGARGTGTGVGVGGMKAKSPVYPPPHPYQQHQRQQSNLSYDDGDPYAQTHYAGGSGSGSGQYDGLRAPQPGPGMISMDHRRQSYRSIADSTYGRYDPFTASHGQNPNRLNSPSPSIMFDHHHGDTQSIAGESVHNLLSRASRTGSMVLLEDNGGDVEGDAALWIDEADYAAMNVMSEMAKAGKPKLGGVIEEEIQRGTGSMIVATCGPATLNTVVRNLVAGHISPGRIRNGDKRGNIALYSEDYEV